MIIFSRVQERGFPGSLAGKESACNAADPNLTPGLGRPPGERIGYPLQYSWASLVAPRVKNPPAMWEPWVPSLGWEDPLEKGAVTHPGVLAWSIPGTEEPGWLLSTGSQRVRHDGATSTCTRAKQSDAAVSSLVSVCCSFRSLI